MRANHSRSDTLLCENFLKPANAITPSNKKVAKQCQKLCQLADDFPICTFIPHAESEVKPFWLLLASRNAP